MADLYGSKTVNGQLIPVFQASGLWGGNGVGPTFRSNGQRPPQSIPTGVTDTAGVATTGVPTTSAPLGGATSTRTLAILGGMLIIGLLGLRYIHWRK